MTRIASGVQLGYAAPVRRPKAMRMDRIVIRLDPQQLDNPDTDMRYVLSDLLSERSDGLIEDDGYDYVGNEPLLMLFFKTSQLEPALTCVVDVVENVRVLDNDLRRGAVVAVERDGNHEVVYPRGFEWAFLPE
jgi:hypothetical protein